MTIKVSMHGIYTIYTYKNLRSWESINWNNLVKNFDKPAKTKQSLEQIKTKYSNRLGWDHYLQKDIYNYKRILGTKYAKPIEILHIPIFAIYNEDANVLKRSLKAIFKSKYPLQRILVFVSQEARMGSEFNNNIYSKIRKLSWTNCYNISEKDLQKVYSNKHASGPELQEYYKKEFAEVDLNSEKLNIIFTQHPNNLQGEIKGKASNEDWGGRQASLFVKSKNIDPELTLLTSLDADSKIGDNFFQMLSFRYCLTENRDKAGFQPLPVYANNYFSANLFPRLVAANTTIWYMIQSSLLDELHLFANYSMPLSTLQKVDFWNREVIGEDSLLFAKCFMYFEGDFVTIPFYGTFEGDAVEGNDYIETIINQYKQLQRWAWGDVEGTPYYLYHFFFEKVGSKISLREKIKIIRLKFLSSFFWATSPIVFSLIVFIPQLVSDREFEEGVLQLNLWLLSQYFAWMSFIFLAISSFVTFRFIAQRAGKNFAAKWYHWIFLTVQWIVSPVLFVLWGPPALDAQIRGITGKYLGYWVTPKK